MIDLPTVALPTFTALVPALPGAAGTETARFGQALGALLDGGELAVLAPISVPPVRQALADSGKAVPEFASPVVAPEAATTWLCTTPKPLPAATPASPLVHGVATSGADGTTVAAPTVVAHQKTGGRAAIALPIAPRVRTNIISVPEEATERGDSEENGPVLDPPARDETVHKGKAAPLAPVVLPALSPEPVPSLEAMPVLGDAPPAREPGAAATEHARPAATPSDPAIVPSARPVGAPVATVEPVASVRQAAALPPAAGARDDAEHQPQSGTRRAVAARPLSLADKADPAVQPRWSTGRVFDLPPTPPLVSLAAALPGRSATVNTALVSHPALAASSPRAGTATVASPFAASTPNAPVFGPAPVVASMVESPTPASSAPAPVAPVSASAPSAAAPLAPAEPLVTTSPPAVAPPSRNAAAMSPGMGLAPAPRETPAAFVVNPVPQPARMVFAAAIAAASSWHERTTDAADPAPVLAPASAPLDAPQAGVPRAPIDLGSEHGLSKVIDRIETLRDAAGEAADARDTRIRLVPDRLGSVEIVVRREGDAVHVHFTAEREATQALLLDAQPRLADLAAQRGVRITEASVSTGTPSDQRSAGPPPRPQHATPHGAPAPAEVTDPSDDTRLA